ncbi:MAG: GWxTD domain-containing protein, partial [Candidatus Aminicenantes bacterium]|nr:GWxTD domain-containing protein [Candidatus Aminicenantes bacterium]
MMKSSKNISSLWSLFALVSSMLIIPFAFGAVVQKEEMSPEHKKWVDEEVIYIISQDEKEVFKSFTTSKQRDDFIESFWKRRDPSPNTPFNEFKEEHYRRIEYANRRYFEGTAGWRSDRGRVYIMFGPPDFFETNPGGARGFLFDVSGPTAEFPSEVWTYRHIPGLKTRVSRVDFTFVNYYNSGKYQFVTNNSLANALRNTSIQGSRDVGYEDPNTLVPGSTGKDLPINSLEQLQIMTELTKSRGEVFEEMERSARLRKLKGIVDTRESLYEMPFVMNETFLYGDNKKMTLPISVEIAGKDVAFAKEEDRYNGAVNFHVEVRDGENTVYQSSERLVMSLLEQTFQNRFSDFYQYKHRLSLAPGKYSLHIVVWDEYDNKVGHLDKAITVPEISDNVFSLSDIILARGIRVVEEEKPVTVNSKDIQALEKLSKSGLKVPETVAIEQKKEEPFTFGNLEINPNTRAEYSTDQELVFFYQIYAPTFSVAENMAKLQIVHQIEKNGIVLETIDEPQEAHLPGSQKSAFLNSGARYDLKDFVPGTYTVVARVTDIVSGKTIEKRADF